ARTNTQRSLCIMRSATYPSPIGSPTDSADEAPFPGWPDVLFFGGLGFLRASGQPCTLRRRTAASAARGFRGGRPLSMGQTRSHAGNATVFAYEFFDRVLDRTVATHGACGAFAPCSGYGPLCWWHGSWNGHSGTKSLGWPEEARERHHRLWPARGRR